MRWVVASVGLLVVIVVFSMAAIDQKDVVWDSGAPRCPHCRTEVNLYASRCAACEKPFDWETWDSVCDVCLSELDADHLTGLIEACEDRLENPEWSEASRKDLARYLDRIGEGSCGYCGGSGRNLDLAMLGENPGNGGGVSLDPTIAAQTDGDCPACFGTGKCPLCAGGRTVEHARESAARGLVDLKRSYAALAPKLEREDVRKEAFKIVRAFLRLHAGRHEIREAPVFGGFDCLSRIRLRLAAVERLLTELGRGS